MKLIVPDALIEQWEHAYGEGIGMTPIRHDDTSRDAQQRAVQVAALLRTTVAIWGVHGTDWPSPLRLSLAYLIADLEEVCNPSHRIETWAGIQQPDGTWTETHEESHNAIGIPTAWLRVFGYTRDEDERIDLLPAFEDVPSGTTVRIQARPGGEYGRPDLVLAEIQCVVRDDLAENIR